MPDEEYCETAVMHRVLSAARKSRGPKEQVRTSLAIDDGLFAADGERAARQPKGGGDVTWSKVL